jgi:uracil-DNA glycosylase
MTWDEWWIGRGHPSEHDPGPPRNRRWARLFAAVPNYRALGVAVTGREMFRWHFGPMFYRGRLGDDQVKVLVIGQEGAQDESLAHRAFTGGTGSRLQHLLNHLGICRSYLFLNTFCYPIFGQYGDHLRWLAQHPASPIAGHRNELFDYAVARNHLQLVVAVGTAAKESVASWLEQHGVEADWRNLDRSDPSPIFPGLRVLGVLHPGGASREVAEDFRRAVATVEEWRTLRAGWLAPDPDGAPGGVGEFEYRSAPLPFRDFAFGTSWRLGRGGTSSNRQDAQRSIQLFSAGGHYNGRGDDPTYRSAALGSGEGYDHDDGDIPHEPPRNRCLDYDRGPDRVMARLLTPDWPAMDSTLAHPSLGFGPVYRGRFEDVTMLVLADPGSDDDLFTGRALTGDDGQHLQRWMEAVGITDRYLILRVPPFDTSGSSRRRREAWVDHPVTMAGYRAIVDRVCEKSPRLGVVVAMGPIATRLSHRLGPRPVVELVAHGNRGARRSWQDATDAMKALRYRKDLRRPSFQFDEARGQIPRRDLPYGTIRWQGTSGHRAVQARVGGRLSGDYYKLFAPRWVAELAPGPLSEAERRAVADA